MFSCAILTMQIPLAPAEPAPTNPLEVPPPPPPPPPVLAVTGVPPKFGEFLGLPDAPPPKPAIPPGESPGPALLWFPPPPPPAKYLPGPGPVVPYDELTPGSPKNAALPSPP